MLRELPSVLQDEACTATVVWRSLVFSIWRDRPMEVAASGRAVDLMLDVGRSLAPKKFALVAMLNENVVPPGAELRAKMEKDAALLARFTACGATVHPGTGFGAATVRGVITALQLVSRSTHPEKVFASDESAIAWLAPKMADAGMRLDDPSEIGEAFRWVRANVRT